MTTRTGETKPRVGFIGMGGMGSRMASRLLAAGHSLTVYNRSRSRTQALEQDGAKVAAQPATLAAGSDIVFSSLADDAAVESVMLGKEGALTAARPGTIFIEMNSSGNLRHTGTKISRRSYARWSRWHRPQGRRP